MLPLTKCLSFTLKFYVMDKELSGEQSCTWTNLVLLGVKSRRFSFKIKKIFVKTKKIFVTNFRFDPHHYNGLTHQRNPRVF